MILTELINKLNEQQRESAGSAVYHLAVLNDIINQGFLSKIKPRLPKAQHKNLFRVRKAIESFGNGTYEGFILMEVKVSDMLGSHVVAFEINEDSIIFNFQETQRDEMDNSYITISSDDIDSENISKEEKVLIEEFYRRLSSILLSSNTPGIQIEHHIKWVRGAVIDRRKEQYDAHFNQIASTIIEQMQNGVESWKMPWHTGIPEAWNPVTGNFYSGKNLMILWDVCQKKEYNHNHWATWLQWKRKRASIRKGEKSTLILVAIPKSKDIDSFRSRVKNGVQMSFDFIDQDTKKTEETEFVFRFVRVFNAGQVLNYNPEQSDLFNPVESKVALVNRFIKKSGADIRKGGIKAYYNSYDDYIQMPEEARFTHQDTFSQSEKYYSTLFHEFIHWTGHSTRCNRSLGNKFGSPEYAFEELVAELGGAILTTRFQNEIHPRVDHAHYIYDWLSVLQHDFSYFTEALKLARSAIYWLYQKTGVLPYELREQNPIQVDHERLKQWNTLVDLN